MEKVNLPKFYQNWISFTKHPEFTLGAFPLHFFTVILNTKKEELTAELGAAFILQALGCYDDRPTSQRDNNITYLDGWSSFLKDAKTELVSASAKAQEASDYILKYAKEYMKENEQQRNEIKQEEER